VCVCVRERERERVAGPFTLTAMADHCYVSWFCYRRDDRLWM